MSVIGSRGLAGTDPSPQLARRQASPRLAKALQLVREDEPKANAHLVAESRRRSRVVGPRCQVLRSTQDGTTLPHVQERALAGSQVSVVGLGCNNFGTFCDEEATRAVVRAALDAGITFFDTADIYGGGTSECLLAKALGNRRDDVVIATKFGLGDGQALPSGASAKSVTAAAEGSLRRLQTDRIDLLQLHAPDLNVPTEETFEALDRLVRDGKVIAIGCSNFDGRLLDQAAATAASLGVKPFCKLAERVESDSPSQRSRLSRSVRASPDWPASVLPLG